VNADRRLAEVRRRIAASDIDSFLANDASNVRYLTGFEQVFDTESASVVVVSAAHAWVYVDSRYHEAALEAARGTPWKVCGPFSDVWRAAVADIASNGAVTLGLESTVEHRRFASVSAEHAGEVVATEDVVEEIRAVKEDREVERITAAAAIGDAAFVHVLERIAAGVTERDIALELEVFMRRNGAEGVAFPPIVAGGPNSSKPHATCSERRFEFGDLIVLDFGARVDGYCSDMTRTVVLGRASEEQQSIYQVVFEANLAGLNALKAGRTGAEVDRAARELIAARGFGDRFGHGLGHGVGLKVHEAPRLGPTGMSVLAAGCVATIEPGVYVPGMGGVRIEDLAVVGETGCRVLTHASKDLVEL